MAQVAIEPTSARDGYAYSPALGYELGPALGPRAAIGLIVLANDYTIEYEFQRILARDGVAVYANRIPMAPMVSLETLREMEAGVAATTDLILPGGHLDVVAYGCTSGTIAIGKEALFARIREARPGVECTTPIVAGVAGCAALGIERIALLTPYVEEVNLGMRAFIEAHGVAVPVMGTFNNPVDVEVARISGESLMAAILELGSGDVDGVFVSCTSLRVTPVLAAAEAALGKPVMSSNQALAWHALRLGGVEDRIEGYGALLMS
jgi:maleate isomerase